MVLPARKLISLAGTGTSANRNMYMKYRMVPVSKLISQKS